MIDIFFANDSNLRANVVKNFLSNIPNITGTVTIKNILIAMPTKEIFSLIFVSPNKLIEVKTIKGIVITQSKLIIAVKDIERATSPLAKDVKILEVTPPGAAAIIITPTASSGAIGQIFTIIKATIGSKIIWEISPTKKSRGCLITLKKSEPVKPKPNTNIIKAKAKGKITSVTIFIYVNIDYKDFMYKRIILFLSLILLVLLLNFALALAESPKNYLKGKFYNSVKNHFLIATEKMKDDRFKETVITMLDSDKDGAWGLVINKPIGKMPLALLIDPSLNTSEEREQFYKINIPVFWGGPVEAKKIFVLHSNEYKSETTKKYGKISLSQDYDILIDIGKRKGPKESLVILGYSGWGSGQLEGEMERDHWILSDIDLEIIFDENSDTKWDKAYKNSFIKL